MGVREVYYIITGYKIGTVSKISAVGKIGLISKIGVIDRYFSPIRYSKLELRLKVI